MPDFRFSVFRCPVFLNGRTFGKKYTMHPLNSVRKTTVAVCELTTGVAIVYYWCSYFGDITVTPNVAELNLFW